MLPAAETLTAAGAQPGTEHVTGAFAGAAIADLEPAGLGRVAVLVAEDLVDALASSPLGGLDLAAATQPALDAVAAALGATAGAARAVELLARRRRPRPLHRRAAARHRHRRRRPDLRRRARHGRGVAGARPSVLPPPSFPATTPIAEARARSARWRRRPRGIEMLHGVDMEVTVELGRTRMTVRELLALSPGTVLELDRAAGSPADLLVNGRLIARGEVVVLDEDFGLRVTEIVDEAAAS